MKKFSEPVVSKQKQIFISLIAMSSYQSKFQSLLLQVIKKLQLQDNGEYFLALDDDEDKEIFLDGLLDDNSQR